MKRLGLCAAIVLVLAAATAFLLPASRYRIVAYLRGEPLYNGRPLDAWVDALKDPQAEARREAALTLAEPEVRQQCAQDEAAGRLVLAGLIESLGDPDELVRKCAATSLLAFPRQTAVPDDGATVAHLHQALGDRDAAVRKAATRAVWQAGKAAGQGDGVARLIDALGDADDYVREYAARALGRIGPAAKPAVPTLLDRLARDEERDVREHAAKSLGLIGAEAIGPLLPQTVQALVKGLEDSAADVRENSARALGQLGARETVPALRKVQADPEPRVREAVDEALKTLDAAPPDQGR